MFGFISTTARVAAKRVDESAKIVALAWVDVSNAIVTVPARLVMDDEMFHDYAYGAGLGKLWINNYTAEHPWRILLGTAMFDREYWTRMGESLTQITESSWAL